MESQAAGVYLDQLSAVPAMECFTAGHTHPPGGGNWWLPAHESWLARMRAVTSKRGFLTSEWNAEPFVHLVDGFLVNHFEYDHQQPIFAAIYGDKILRFSRFHDTGGKDEVLSFRMKLGQALVYGDQLGWIANRVLEIPENRKAAIAFGRLRYRLNDYFNLGQMGRPPKVIGTVPTVTADWYYYWQPRIVSMPAVLTGLWTKNDRSAIALFVNVSGKDVSFKTSLSGFESAKLWLGEKMIEKGVSSHWINTQIWKLSPGEIMTVRYRY